MAVGAESCAFLDTVFVDDAEWAESFIFGVVVGGEGEGVETV
jgi:hypothetical protein